MNEIFSSEEFKKFEALCHSKKCSFLIALTKFSSVNKPKKGPVYIMSDFFVYDVPKDWERKDIRPTPPDTWLNPKPPPPLSQPLSKLIQIPHQIKLDFIEVWNHIHGVVTETYFCPKLYLTRIPRIEVEKFMEAGLLPKGPSTLSCADLVHFPVFVTWLKSTVAEEARVGETRVKFVALLITLAFNMYKVDPEQHCKEGGSEKDRVGEVEVISLDSSEEVNRVKKKKESKEVEVISLESAPGTNGVEQEKIGGSTDNKPREKETEKKTPDKSTSENSSTSNKKVTREIEVISIDEGNSNESCASNKTPEKLAAILNNTSVTLTPSPSKDKTGCEVKVNKTVQKKSTLSVSKVAQPPSVSGTETEMLNPTKATVSVIKKSPLKVSSPDDDIEVIPVEKSIIRVRKDLTPLSKVRSDIQKALRTITPNLPKESLKEKFNNAAVGSVTKAEGTDSNSIKHLQNVENIRKGKDDDLSPKMNSKPVNKVQETVELQGEIEILSPAKITILSEKHVNRRAKILDTKFEPGENKATLDVELLSMTKSDPDKGVKAKGGGEPCSSTTMIPTDVLEAMDCIEIDSIQSQLESMIEVKSEGISEDVSDVSDLPNSCDPENHENIHDKTSITNHDSATSKKTVSTEREARRKPTEEKKASSTLSKPTVEKEASDILSKPTAEKNAPDILGKNDVSEALGSLIQVCVKLMSKEEYTLFSRKVSKYLNSIDSEKGDLNNLICFIDEKRLVIKENPKNIFVHLKAVFDKMKKFKKVGKDDSLITEHYDSSNNHNQEILIDSNSSNSTEQTKQDKSKNISKTKELSTSCRTTCRTITITTSTSPVVSSTCSTSTTPIISSTSSSSNTTTNTPSSTEQIDSEADKDTEPFVFSLEEVNETMEISEIVQTVCDTVKEEHKHQGVNEKKQESFSSSKLKESFQSFLKLCQASLPVKQFHPHYKIILKYINAMDPAHLNLHQLGEFVSQQHEILEKDTKDIFKIIAAVIEELKKYQTNNKRKIDVDNEKAPPEKKICLDKPSNSNKIGTSETVDEGLDPKTIFVVKDTGEILITVPGVASKAPQSSKDGLHNMEIEELSKKDSAVEKRLLPEEQEKGSEPVKKKICLTSIPLVVNIGGEPVKKKISLTSIPVVRIEKCNVKKIDTEKDLSDKAETKSDDNCEIIEPEEPSTSKQTKRDKPKVSKKHIEKLEEALKKCGKKIRKLEEAEVDWDNEDDESNYILCAKFKRRYMEIFNKIAESKRLSKSLDRKSDKRFKCSESRYPEINKKIEKFVNKNKEFPDFQDIRKLVAEANQTLFLSETQCHDEAETIFQSVGKRLKLRREQDDSSCQMSYLKQDQMVDPASQAEDLEKRLQEQVEEGKQRINKYFDDFYKKNVIMKSGTDKDEDKDEDEDTDEESDAQSEKGFTMMEGKEEEDEETVRAEPAESDLTRTNQPEKEDSESTSSTPNLSGTDKKQNDDSTTANNLGTISTETVSDSITASKSKTEGSNTSTTETVKELNTAADEKQNKSNA